MESSAILLGCPARERGKALPLVQKIDFFIRVVSSPPDRGCFLFIHLSLQQRKRGLSERVLVP